MLLLTTWHYVSECLRILSIGKRNFIFSELSNFIAQGRISAKIDKVLGVVECVQDEPTVDLYHKTLKESDLLLNKVHKLSKLLEL